jgi:hypothetical protein
MVVAVVEGSGANVRPVSTSTTQAAAIAPSSCDTMYGSSSFDASLPRMTSASVTAGL